MNTWHFDFYFVGQRRADGTAPTLEKAVDQKFFLTHDSAKPLLDIVTKEVGDYYGIFPAMAIIPRCRPVQREIQENDPEWAAILNDLKDVLPLPERRPS
jgi:hypothetical protein